GGAAAGAAGRGGGAHRRGRLGGPRMTPGLGLGAPRWAVEGRGWPNADASRFPRAAGLRWHVQVMGPEEAPAVVLLHGLGGATHSWADVAPRLARRFRVIVPDLPGHGFTERPGSAAALSPVRQAEALGALFAALGARPAVAAGHSAGAPLAARLALDGVAPLTAVVSFNGAWLPFPGLMGQVFPGLARALSMNPFVPGFFSLGASLDPRSTERLIAGTGSKLRPERLDAYARLFRRPGHVAAALAMMSVWDLAAILADLPRLEAELTLVAAAADRAVPPETARTVADRAPYARVEDWGGLGHLAHEEAPGRAAALVVEAARRAGVLAPA
ncbi:MAG: alpha/beta fold hydrolase BchO, partial [Paracoccaceae bacterium]